MSRRELLSVGAQVVGAAALGCTVPAASASTSDYRLRRRNALPSTELSWLRLHDHFIATVGPSAGSGRPLGNLLVLADATFAPRSRFPIHPHKDVEILSIVLDGELSHHGDQSHGEVIRARQAQLISARDGIVHAEGNDTDRETRMLQLWFAPNERGGTPSYHVRTAPAGRGRHLLAGDEAMPMRTDARVWWLDLAEGEEARLEVAQGRAGYLLSLDTALQLAGRDQLEAGDGAEVREGTMSLRALRPGNALWVDLAAT